jgi:phage baseplate assembly protein W
VNLAYPYQLSQLGRTGESADEAHARDLIEQVLFTAPSERVMRPEFGCGLAQLVFAPSSIEVASATGMLVQSALQRWLGDLITVRNVSVEASEHVLSIVVEYYMRRTDDLRVETFQRAIGCAP